MNGPDSRGRLFRKYVVVLLVLVGGVLMASSLVELYFSYRETQLAIVRVERAKAVAAAAGIEQFLKEVEQQVRETTRTASDDPDASQVGQGKLGFRQGLGAAMAEQRELDFLRVLRNVPAVSELTHLDLAGKEQLRVSRLDPDVVGSQEDLSRAPKFAEARAGKTYWSPVYFRNESEPYVTLAVPVGKYAVEVTTAEISLAAVLKMVSQIEVGPGGYAYVVDSRSQLVAHPDSRMLRDKRDLSALAQVKSARTDRAGSTADAPAAVVADGLGGGRVLAAHAAIAPLGGFVFVESPAADAYAPLRAPIIRSVVIFVLGLGLSMLASLFLARRMVAPIRVLQEGAERIGAGRLDEPIELHTGDEIEALAGSFNRMTASLKESYEGLEQKVEARTRELADANRGLTEALEQQTATSEILRVISSSPTDIQPVLDAVADSAARLCESFDSTIWRRDGDRRLLVAHHGPIPTIGPLGTLTLPLIRGTAAGRSVLDGRIIHVADLQTEVDEFPEGSENAQRMGFRTILSVPLIREGVAIGVIQLRRTEVQLFTERQVALLQTFADQAVIAIENVRLFKELETRNRDLTEALEQQTATSEILRVISQSPTEVQPVFDTIVRSAVRLCDGLYGSLFRFDGELMHLAAHHNYTPEALRALQQMVPMRPRPDSRLTAARAILMRAPFHVADAQADREYASHIARAGGFGSVLAVPMLREASPVGSLFVARAQRGPFSETQIALLQTFADQAVIAVENVRLFKELEAKNRDLTEALEQQTATAEILKVISSSPTDILPVLQAVAQSATRLCEAYDAMIALREGETLRVGAHHGPIPIPWQAAPRPLNRGWVSGRAVVDRQVVHVHDLAASGAEFPLGQADAAAAGHRTTLGVPLLRENEAIGVILIRRLEVRPFTDTQIALLQTFADQAVIAIENVRLFKELDARNGELTEALEQQTATSEILRVISQSQTDVQPVFDTIARSAVTLCGALSAAVFRLDGERLLVAASHGPLQNPAGDRSLGRQTLAGRAVLERRPVHVADVQAEVVEFPEGSAFARALGHRTVLSVPLLREGMALGAINLRRAEVAPFTDRQIELVQTFADQAVIAIENVRLFKELEARNTELGETLARQTATGEVLRAISGAQTDAQPVFDIIAASALRLCNAGFSVVTLYDGELVHLAAQNTNYPEGAEAIRRAYPLRPGDETAVSRAIRTRVVVQIPDVLEDRAYELKSQAQAVGFRSFLAAPMLRDGEPIGTIGVGRAEPGPFSDKQVELLKTFADQAVIAIENVRLFTELQARTQELTRSVEELRALGEVGQAVSSSLDIQSVLTSIVTHAVELSQTDAGTIYEFDEVAEVFVPQASYGIGEELIEALRQSRIRVGEGGIGQAAKTRAAVQIPDLVREPNYALPFLLEAGYRALLAVPLLRENRVIGGLVVRRKAAGTFPTPIVDLLQTFATQSVLAIQNARLFREIDEKSQALEELSRNQEQLSRLSTALQEPLSLTEQLTRVLDAARQVVGLDRIYVWTLSPAADGLQITAQAGFEERDWHDLAGVTIPMGEAGALATVCRDGVPLRFTEADPLPAEYRLRPPYSTLAGLRVRSFLVIPMIARGRTVGVLAADNRASRAPIPAHTVDLLQTFAGQAAVAVENARLFQEIQDKSQQLELASKHKSQFLANMSHELRTPMNAVLGYTDLILDDIFGEVPAPIRETLERVKTNGQHLLSLINDVLDLSKMEAGQLTLSLGDYAMGEVVHAVVSTVESLAAGKKLALKATVPDDLPPGHGDERRLTQVLLNLAGNAIKFTDTGEVSIEARAAGGNFVVSVSDTGPGISEADQQKIFEEFQQADSSSTRTKGGSGLGLSISRRIVELHGGRLWVESALGQGSTFHFTVPLRVERQAERA